MIISKKVVGLVVALILAAVAFIVFMPSVSSAQVVDVCDILDYTEEEANPSLPDPFDLDFPNCDDEGGDDNDGGDDEGDGNEDDDNGEEDNEDNDTDNGGSNGGSSGSGSSGGGGGGRGMHIAGTPSSVSYNGGGEVLGESVEVCSTPLLYSYLRMGNSNDSDEVLKLQEFLNGELGLELELTGIFDDATEDAVEQFQLKYADQVLAPWLPYGLESIDTPTGYVYKTTQRTINKIYCSSLEIPMPQLP